MKKIFGGTIFFIVIIVVLCLPAIAPFLKSGYFPTHDGEWAVVRLADMFRSLKDLQFPVRFSGNLNFGYGYPLFNFAYPLPYYLGVIVYSLGIGFVDSIKFLFATSVILSAVGMYFLSKEMWKNNIAGFISSLLYVYLPYRFVDLYVRGSLGESISFAIFPMLFLIILKLSKSRKKFSLIFLGGIFYGSLIMTHNIMAVLFTPLFIFFSLFIWNENERKDLVTYFLVPISGLFFSAFFWIPALLEKKLILLSVVPIADRNLYFVNLQQLLFPSWGYGPPTEKGGFSYQLGIAHLLVVLISLIIFFLIRRDRNLKKMTRQFLLLFVFFIFMVLMLFQFTSILWERLPLLSEINYPWTLLALIGFIISLFAGFVVNHKFFPFIGLGIVLLTLIFTIAYARPERYVDKGDNFYLTNDATTTSSSELMPLWVKSQPFARPGEKVEILSGKGSIKTSIVNSREISFTANLKSDGKIRINTIYYPGWKIKTDGHEQNFLYNNDKGVMDLPLFKGTHQVKAVFIETPLRMTADIVSMSTFVLFIFTFAWTMRRKIFIKNQ